MVVATPTNKSVLGLQGLHLYHADISNCSMRVRITLEEKGLTWTSHHLDLRKRENVTEEYFGINSKGLVPTLVHDGVVIVESTDIIDYLDETFPDPPLRPSNTSDRKAVGEWTTLAASIHVKAVKTWTYAVKMGSVLKKSDEELQKYRNLQTNQELLDFHSKVQQGFTQEDIDRAGQILKDRFVRIDAELGQHEWLVGDTFTLADIAWVPLHFTLIGSKFSFDEYSNIGRWVEAIRKRPSFRKGVLQWCEKF